MIRFDEVSLGTGDGALVCPKCRRDARVPGPRPLDDIRADLARAARDGVRGPGPNVTFTGFEPFAHPDLVTIIASARSAGFERIRLRTDGGALAVPANARGVLAAGVTLVEVVLLGDEETHDRVVGRSGAFARATEGCRSYLSVAREEGVSVALTGLVPACAHTIPVLAEAVAALTTVGAVAVEIDAGAVPRNSWTLVESALDTAAMAGVAAFVTNAGNAPGSLYGLAPWDSARGEVR